MLRIDSILEATKNDILSKEEKNYSEQIKQYGFDNKAKAVYEKLIPMFVYAGKQGKIITTTEQEEEIKKTARERACKLSILFRGYDEAIAYLKACEARLSASPAINQDKKILEHACKFSLPVEEGWNINLWRALVKKDNINSPDALILRLLPHAKKIEDYIKNNKEEIEENIRKEVAAEFETQFSQEYDNIKSSQTKETENIQLTEKEKENIKNTATKELDSELRSRLKFPEKGKPTAAQIQDFKNEKLKPDYQDKLKDKIVTLEEKEIKKKTEAAEKNRKNVAESANKSKNEYVEEALKKTESTIQKIAKDRLAKLLQPTTSTLTLCEQSESILYNKAKENPDAALLFFKYNIKENVFEDYLKLNPLNDAKLIPDIVIEGGKIAPQYKGYYLKKLTADDPRAAILGRMTSCCQTLGEEGNTSAIHGITQPEGGFYAICTQNQEGVESIVSQCWAWRNTNGEIVFDSIESQCDFYKNNLQLTADFYTYLGSTLVSSHDVPRVLVGTGGNTPNQVGTLKSLHSFELPNYDGYRDSKQMRIISDENLPLIDMYVSNNKETRLNPVLFPNKKLTDAQIIKEWAELYALNLSEFEKSAELINSQQDKDLFLQQKKDLFLQQVDVGKRALFIRHVEHTTAYFKELAKENINWDTIKGLIEKGVNPQIQIPDKWINESSLSDEVKKSRSNNIITLAVQMNNPTFLEWLITTKKVDIHVKDQHDHDAIYYAMVTNQLDVLKRLVTIDQQKKTAAKLSEEWIWPAIEHNNAEMVKFLLSQDVDIHIKHSNGSSLLQYAFSQNAPFDIIETLVNHKANIKELSVLGQSFLVSAVTSGNIETVKLFLKHGESIDVLDKDGDSLLHYAVRSKDLDMVKFLVDNGANINAQNHKGQSVLAKALMSGEVVSWLLKNKANVNIANESGETPLLGALFLREKNVFNELIDHGANVFAKTNSGMSILQFAYHLSHYDFINMAIEKINITKVNATDFKQETLDVQNVLLNSFRNKYLENSQFMSADVVAKFNELYQSMLQKNEEAAKIVLQCYTNKETATANDLKEAEEIYTSVPEPNDPETMISLLKVYANKKPLTTQEYEKASKLYYDNLTKFTDNDSVNAIFTKIMDNTFNTFMMPNETPSLISSGLTLFGQNSWQNTESTFLQNNTDSFSQGNTGPLLQGNNDPFSQGNNDPFSQGNNDPFLQGNHFPFFQNNNVPFFRLNEEKQNTSDDKKNLSEDNSNTPEKKPGL